MLRCLRPFLLVLLAAALGTVACQQDQLQGDGSSGAATDVFGAPAAGSPGAAAGDSPFGTAHSATSTVASSGQFGLAPGIGAPGGEPRMMYQGIATVAYGPQPLSTPYQAVSLGCGLGFVSPTFQSNYIGVSSQYFQEGMACGRCIKLQCDDQSCGQAGKELPALVADVCGSCTGPDLSIAAPLFRNLTGRDPGANPSIVVSWDLTPCAPYTKGTIKMLVKNGGSAFYQAFVFSNYILPILQVKVNDQELEHGSDNAWAWNPGQPIDPTAPLDVALLGSNREVLRARVPSLRSADLGLQFKAQ